MQTKHSLSTIFLLAMFLVILALPTHAATTPGVGIHAPTRIQPDWGEMPLYFIANQGQMDSRVAYYVQGSDKTLYFTSEGVTVAMAPPSSARIQGDLVNDRENPPNAPHESSRWIVKLDFLSANPVRPLGQNPTETTISYFKGTRDEWRTGSPTYSQIVYHDLWAGVDLVYNGTVNKLKYEFVVQPGADPAHIRLAYRGATVSVNEAGQLQVSTPAGDLNDDAPVAYQEIDGARVPVTVHYALDDTAPSGADEPHPYGFQLGAYDPALPLVIDPVVLVYCGFIGGSGDDHSADLSDIAVDTAGNAYVIGTTTSSEATFPVTVGPDLSHNGGQDVFVAKVNASGTALVYAGYIGGSGNERGYRIAVDSTGNAYVYGTTTSSEATFPVTVGPDLTYNGGAEDVFVAKVNASGTALVYAGYIGGNGDDWGGSMAVDLEGNVYVTGITSSTQATFPVKVGPDLTHNGVEDAFVAKVKADGAALVYCGYIGGSTNDRGWGIAVDGTGHAYIVGITGSSESTFPVTVGPDLTDNGGIEVFVAKVDPSGATLIYCGYIGGSGEDFTYGIAVDTAGNAYVSGPTGSDQSTFPVTVGPDLTYNGGDYDVFVAKVNASGTALVYCGYIGGSGTDYAYDIAIDAAGNVYVVGSTTSSEATFPVTGGPDLTYNGGDYDVYVAKVNASGTALEYAGYIGGSGVEWGQGIAVDTAGNAYVTGNTDSTEATFPVTGGPDLTYNGGTTDAFVAKISYKVYLPLVLHY